MPQAYDDGTFEIDHIIAASHGGAAAGYQPLPGMLQLQ
jgi:hypothetical protein